MFESDYDEYLLNEKRNKENFYSYYPFNKYSNENFGVKMSYK